MTHHLTGDFFIHSLQSYKIYLLLFGALIVFGVIIYRYYSKDRIKKLQAQYDNNKYNKLISDKLILSVSHIELTIVLILWFVIANI